MVHLINQYRRFSLREVRPQKSLGQFFFSTLCPISKTRFIIRSREGLKAQKEFEAYLQAKDKPIELEGLNSQKKKIPSPFQKKQNLYDTTSLRRNEMTSLESGNLWKLGKSCGRKNYKILYGLQQNFFKRGGLPLLCLGSRSLRNGHETIPPQVSDKGCVSDKLSKGDKLSMLEENLEKSAAYLRQITAEQSHTLFACSKQKDIAFFLLSETLKRSKDLLEDIERLHEISLIEGEKSGTPENPSDFWL